MTTIDELGRDAAASLWADVGPLADQRHQQIGLDRIRADAGRRSDGSAPRTPRRRWAPLVLAAAAALIAIVVGAVVTLGGDRSRTLDNVPASQVDAPTLPTAEVTNPATIETSAPTAPPSSAPLAPDTAPSVVETVDTTPVETAATEVAPPTDPMPPSTEPTASAAGAHLVVPATLGVAIEPTRLGEIAAGDGPGQLLQQNGEFEIPAALFGDSILVLEDDPFNGFTGRAVELDLAGGARPDVAVEAITGETPFWSSGSPNGTLFVISLGPDGTTTLRALGRDGATFREIQAVSLDAIPNERVTVEPNGVAIGGTIVMGIETGAEPRPVEVEVASDAVPGGIRFLVSDGRTTAPPWTIDVGLIGPPPSDPLSLVSGFGTLGDGLWLRGITSDDPNEGRRFLATLAPDGSTDWVELGRWSVAAADGQRLLLTQVTSTGVAIATVGG